MTNESQFNPTTGNWLLATVILGSAMAFIDGSGVNIALPEIQRELEVDTRSVQWVAEAYVLMLAALTLVGGALCDRHGRRRCYAIGILLFACASLACAAAVDVRQLVIARGLQGIGGALLLPGGLALIGGYFPAEKRGRAIGTWAACGAIGGMVAPLLSGWLIETLSWRWIFYLNLPLSIITLTLLFTRVPESWNPHRSGSPDWAGAGLASVALSLLVFGLIEYPGRGISHPQVAGTLVAGALLLLLFLWVESRSQSPMLPLGLFRSPLFSGVNFATLLLYTGLNGTLFFLPFYLIYVLNFSAVETGASFMPMSIAILLLSRRVGGLAGHRPRALLVTGSCCTALAYLLLSRTGPESSYWLTVFPGVITIGLGMGLCIAPITHVALGAVAGHQTGLASGVNNAVARLSSVLAIALFGIVISHHYNRELDQGLSDLNASPAVVNHFKMERAKLAAATPPASLPSSESSVFSGLIKRAFSRGFGIVCLFSMALSLATALCLWLTIPPAGLPNPDP